jgi:hypothetical protein
LGRFGAALVHDRTPPHTHQEGEQEKGEGHAPYGKRVRRLLRNAFLRTKRARVMANSGKAQSTFRKQPGRQASSIEHKRFPNNQDSLAGEENCESADRQRGWLTFVTWA